MSGRWSRLAGAVADDHVRLAHGLPGHGSPGLYVAGCLVGVLPQSRPASACLSGGVGPHPERSARSGSPGPLAVVVALPPDVGVRGGHVPQCTHLVVLSVLDSGLSEQAVRVGPVASGTASGGDLLDDRRGQRRRRVAVFVAPQARLECERRPQNSDADLRLCVVPVFAASQVPNLWVATLLVGLAASAHQGFSANLYTLVSDTAPHRSSARL